MEVDYIVVSIDPSVRVEVVQSGSYFRQRHMSPNVSTSVPFVCPHVLLGNTSIKKNVFFRALPELPLSPPPPPLSGNLYIFFGRQKGIYKVYFLIRARASY